MLLLGIISCSRDKLQQLAFNGNNDAVSLATTMFESIGGAEKWCALKSLYIKAEHTEPQMDIPYQSEIWRAIDRFELVIEQQNDSFHVKGIFNSEEGTIHYLDDRDTFRVLDNEQLVDFEYDHNHNVYVLLNKLACNPADYRVEIDTSDRITFFHDTAFICSFALDELNRPFGFYPPLKDGIIAGSIFTHWATHDDLVHSASGHALDSSFFYRTEVWIPSMQSLSASFDEKIFDVRE